MLYLVGLGLKPEHLTQEALSILKSCDRVYLDGYTSAYAQGNVQDLEETLGKKVFPLQRSQLEEKAKEWLTSAKSNNVALCVMGNPFFATTHITLLLLAQRLGIPWKAALGVSVHDALGALGLISYRFGRTVSVTFWTKSYKPESFYDQISANFTANLHSLCLLDFDPATRKYMDAKEAIALLERIERKRKEKILSQALFVSLIAGGTENQRVQFGMLDEMKSKSFEGYPQALIICAPLTENEREALFELHGKK